MLYAEYKYQEEQFNQHIAGNLTRAYIRNGLIILFAMCGYPMFSFVSANLGGHTDDADVIKLRKMKAKLEERKRLEAEAAIPGNA